MNWTTKGIESDDWELIKAVLSGNIAGMNDFHRKYGYLLGSLSCGSLLFDIQLFNVGEEEPSFSLGAKAYLLGEGTGHDFTDKRTPYNCDGSIDLDVDLHNNYEEFLTNLYSQLNTAVEENKKWQEAASKTNMTWEDEQRVIHVHGDNDAGIGVDFCLSFSFITDLLHG